MRKLRDLVNLIIGGDVKDAQIAVGDRNIQIKDFPNAQIYVNPQFAGIPAQDIPDKELILAYLRSLASECSRLPLGVVDPRFLEKMQDDFLSLSGIYIDLDVQPPFEEGEEKHKAKEEFQFFERNAITAFLSWKPSTMKDYDIWFYLATLVPAKPPACTISRLPFPLPWARRFCC